MSTAFEQHYKAAKLAKLWGLSYETVLRRAKDYEGVLKVGRKRITVTIPESVALKLHAELTGNPTCQPLGLASLGNVKPKARNVSR